MHPVAQSMTKRILIVTLLAAAFVASGCLSFGEGSPEEQVEQAMHRLQEDMGLGGDVKKLTGEMEAEGMKIDMEIEFGSNDALRIVMDAGMFRIVMICTQDAAFVSFAGETYESRPDKEMCELDFEDGPDLFNGQEDEAEIIRIEQQDDGSLVAELSETEDGVETRTTIVIRDARVVEITFEDDEASGTFTVEYGSRRAISAPEAVGRIPASVHWNVDFAPGVYTATMGEVDEELPLDEFQVQVRDFDGTELAAFPLATQGPQSMGGFEFEYHDTADGLLETGDRFTLQRSGWDHEWDYDVVLFDEWAGVTTDEHPIPAPGVVWLVLVLLGVIGLGTRNRSG